MSHRPLLFRDNLLTNTTPVNSVYTLYRVPRCTGVREITMTFRLGVRAAAAGGVVVFPLARAAQQLTTGWLMRLLVISNVIAPNSIINVQYMLLKMARDNKTRSNDINYHRCTDDGGLFSVKISTTTLPRPSKCKSSGSKRKKTPLENYSTVAGYRDDNVYLFNLASLT